MSETHATGICTTALIRAQQHSPFGQHVKQGDKALRSMRRHARHVWSYVGKGCQGVLVHVDVLQLGHVVVGSSQQQHH